MAASRSTDPSQSGEGRRRVIIEGVEPEIDCGKFPAKGVEGDPFVVEADVFADGHDVLRSVLLYKTERQRKWREVEMEPLGNDRWRSAFLPEETGRHLYTIEAWIDRWGTWIRDLRKRVAAGQDVSVDLLIGADIADAYASSARGNDKRRIRRLAERLRTVSADGASAGESREGASGGESGERASGGDSREGTFQGEPMEAFLDELEGDASLLLRQNDPRRFATRYEQELAAWIDRPKAVFSAWYEFFPRSTGPAGEHGTFATAAEFLPYVADMGFDVVYLPPIHPVGRTKRKGKNNRPEAEAGDFGSPWAIGAEEGGHKALHPELGTMHDFQEFRKRAEELGLEVAIDVAFQVAPDHPWVEKHPDWFTSRPDGTIQYAENPPKKYEDIYPIDFQSDDWKNLWEELKSVFDFWIDKGVKIFRVDNPHTKSFRFWAWCIPAIQRDHPEVLFLSEAFTRPRLMYNLAKAGFTQSYTYFAWRDRPREMRQYLHEITQSEVRHYFRPNFWPNTPDILTETLQHGGRGAFMMRLVLAATLTSNYGIYGPAFELLEHKPRNPGSEEYLDSEKYQIRDWNVEQDHSIRELITRINQIRREHLALQRNDSLRFHGCDNDMLLVYSKRPPPGRGAGSGKGAAGARTDALLMVVNMDPHHRQSGWVDLDLQALGLDPGQTYQVHDLIGGDRYDWRGGRNYVELDPHVMPAHVFRIISGTARKGTP